MKLHVNKCRMLYLVMALLMAVVPAMASTENTAAMDEEDGANVFVVEPGTYEWYQLASDYEDDHAYLEMWPEQETVTMKNGVWNYTFNMEEVGGVSFYPYTIIVIGFYDGVEMSRTVKKADGTGSWWAGEIPAGSTITYSGTENNSVLNALALSVIGTDAEGFELEFHSIVYLAK